METKIILTDDELAAVIGGNGEENDACPNCGSKRAVFVKDETGEHYRCLSCGTLRGA